MSIFKESILVLGGTGFIGRNLIKSLKKKYKISSISLNQILKEKKCSGVKYKRLDLRKKNNIKKIKKNYDYIINCLSFNRNQKIFNFFLKFKPQKFIHIGCSGEYGKIKVPFKESDKCLPKTNYGLSKLFDTMYLLNLYKNFKFPVVIVRLFNVYGKDQGRYIISEIVSNCKKNNVINLANGSQTRDFCHIDDISKAVNLIIRSKNKRLIGKILNISTGKETSIRSLSRIILRKVKKGKINFIKRDLDKNSILRSKADIKLSKKLLNWRPKIDILKGIDLTIYGK